MPTQRAFARAFFAGLRIIWPVLSGLIAMIAGIGAVIALLEGWTLWRGVYFAFVTALTIGYGDLVPTRRLTQALAILLGFTGVTVTALLAGVAVSAFRTINRDEREP